MFSPAALAFWFAYLLTGWIAISVCLRSGWHPIVKAATLVLTVSLYLAHYQLFPLLAGWPINGRLPDNFRLLAANVDEPDKQHGRTGTIMLWTMSLDDNPLPKPPRAFQLPYSVSLHEQVNAAITKIRRGLPQLGQTRYHVLLSNNAAATTAFSPKRMDLEFFDVPDPLFPKG